METTRLIPIYVDLRNHRAASDGIVLDPARGDRMEDLLQRVRIDQRSRTRFPIQLNAFYRTLGSGHSRVGVGSVVNISSSGVLIASQLELRSGTRMELNMDWPVKLEGQVSLQLIAVGTVVRCEMSGFALSLGQHQFRTKGSTVTPIEVPVADAMEGQYPQNARQ